MGLSGPVLRMSAYRGTPELAHGQNVDPEQTWPAKFADHYFLNVSNIEQCRRTQKSMLVHHRPFGIDL
jgi:hypothetical protein